MQKISEYNYVKDHRFESAGIDTKRHAHTQRRIAIVNQNDHQIWKRFLWKAVRENSLLLHLDYVQSENVCGLYVATRVVHHYCLLDTICRCILLLWETH